MHWVLNFGQGKSPCRVNHASVSIGCFIYSFGGYSQQHTSNELKKRNPIDVHVLNTITFRWKKRPLPDQSDQQYEETPYFRYGHTCVTYNDLIYLWGGRSDWTNDLCNILYKYEPKTHKWYKVHVNGEIPDGRDGHTACIKNDSMFIFGGFVQKTKKFSNDLHEYNFLTSNWSLIVPKNDIRPYWRDFHSASIIEDKMYIFGGRMDVGQTRFTGENFYSNDLHVYDFSTKKWKNLIPDQTNVNNTSSEYIQCPEGRRSHSAIVHNQKILIFGGYQENLQKHFNDLFEYNPKSNLWNKIKSKGKIPCQRRRHGCNVVNNQMIIFGGTGPRKSETTNQDPGSSSNLTLEPIGRTNNLEISTIGRLLQTLRDFDQANEMRDRHHPIIQHLNNLLERAGLQLNNLRAEPFPIAEPQFLNQINQPNDNNHENQLDFVEDDEFLDSDTDDLINEETDEDDDNMGLISLSDLHILDLGVPSLKILSRLSVIEHKLDYANLPKILIDEIEIWKQ